MVKHNWQKEKTQAGRVSKNNFDHYRAVDQRFLASAKFGGNGIF